MAATTFDLSQIRTDVLSSAAAFRALAGCAADAEVVHLTNAEVITGAKTFREDIALENTSASFGKIEIRLGNTGAEKFGLRSTRSSIGGSTNEIYSTKPVVFTSASLGALQSASLNSLNVSGALVFDYAFASQKARIDSQTSNELRIRNSANTGSGSLSVGAITSDGNITTSGLVTGQELWASKAGGTAAWIYNSTDGSFTRIGSSGFIQNSQSNFQFLNGAGGYQNLIAGGATFNGNVRGSTIYSDAEVVSENVGSGRSLGMLADGGGNYLLSSHALHIKNSSGSAFQDISVGGVQIGTNQTRYGAISIQQFLTGSGYSAGFHGVEDYSMIATTGMVGYAAFDAKAALTGTYGHAVGFQSRLQLPNATITDHVSSFDAAPIHSAGTIQNVYGMAIRDIIGTGTVVNDHGIDIASTIKGTVNNYGVKIGPVQGGTGANWGIYCESQSRFLSPVSFAGSNPSVWSPVNLGAANANIGNRISVYENPVDGTYFRGIGFVNPGIYGLGLFGGTGGDLPTDSTADMIVATGGNVLVGSNIDNGAKLQVAGAATVNGAITSSSVITGLVTGGTLVTGVVNRIGMFGGVSDGNGFFADWASASTFVRLGLGPLNASFPCIKRSGVTVAFRLGDDSADAPVTAATITASGLIKTVNGSEFIGTYANSGAGNVFQSSLPIYVVNGDGVLRQSLYAGDITATALYVDADTRWNRTGAGALSLQCYSSGLAAWQTGLIQEASGSGIKMGFFGQSSLRVTGGASTAGGTYTSAEQTMLQTLWDMARAYGFLT